MKIGNLIQNVLEGIKNLRPRLGLYNVCSIISFIVLYIQRILNNLELGRQIPGIHNSLLSKSQWRKNANGNNVRRGWTWASRFIVFTKYNTMTCMEDECTDPCAIRLRRAEDTKKCWNSVKWFSWFQFCRNFTRSSWHLNCIGYRGD